MKTLQALDRLLSVLPGRNRFYAPRLAACGLDRGCDSVDDFRARMPFTTKADLVADQAAHPPFGTNLTEPLDRYTRFCQTSGTTSAPLAILDTPESWEWMLNNWCTIYDEAVVRPGDRIYFAFSFGPFLGFWTAFEAATRYGCLCLPGGGLSSGARLAAMNRFGAQVLCCTPTYALHLAATAEKERFDLSQCAVRKIIVAGEPGGSVPAVRERISAAWNGAKVIDHYGLTEVGPTAFQRVHDPEHLRIIESSYLAEVIDSQTGEEATRGELVLTTLGRTASPLLRYRTGDLVELDTTQPGFALRGGVLGRADDMVVVRGLNLYPSAVEAVVRSVPEIAEYQVHLWRTGALWEAEVEAEATAAAAEELERALTATFSLRIPVRRAEAGSLPRSELKAHRWLRRDS